MSLRPPAAAWQNYQEIVRWCQNQDTWTRIIKGVDEARPSDATIGRDSELQFLLDANTTYIIRLVVFFDTEAAPDFRFRFTGPASPTYYRVKGHYLIPGSTTENPFLHTAALTLIQVTGTGSTGGFVKADAVIQNGANRGLFSFDWSQDQVDAADTIVRAGSYIEYCV